MFVPALAKSKKDAVASMRRDRDYEASLAHQAYKAWRSVGVTDARFQLVQIVTGSHTTRNGELVEHKEWVIRSNLINGLPPSMQ